MAGHVAELIHRFRSYVSTLLEIRRLQLLDRPNESEVVLFFQFGTFTIKDGSQVRFWEVLTSSFLAVCIRNTCRVVRCCGGWV